MECFYCRMRFSATIYNNNWVYADNLAPFGQGVSTDICLTPERERDIQNKNERVRRKYLDKSS